jgi:Rod binding domain-containing protein
VSDTILPLSGGLASGGLGSLPTPMTSLNPSNKKDSPERIHQAAQQFESLLISQILKTAHNDSEGWLGTGDDEAGSSAMSIAEEQLAQALSVLIEKGLTKSTNGTAR